MSKADELAKEINKKYFHEGVGRKFYLNFVDKIKEVGAINFLAAHVKISEARNALSLMLQLPELWKNFTVDDWLKLMKDVGDRPAYAKKGQIGDVGVHADLMLLCKYLEINGIDLYLNYAQVTEKNRLTALTYMNGFLREFVKDDLDYEDLSEGEDNVFDGLTLKDLEVIKQRLLKDPRAKEFPHDELAARVYIKQLYQQQTKTAQAV